VGNTADRGNIISTVFTNTFHRVRNVAVSFGDIDPFSVEAIQCYKEHLEAFNSKEEGKIKAVILTNPHNPFGKCYVRLPPLPSFSRLTVEGNPQLSPSKQLKHSCVSARNMKSILFPMKYMHFLCLRHHRMQTLLAFIVLCLLTPRG